MTSLVCFTDPFCTWSWGSEPMLRNIRVRFGDQIEREFVMGGLVEDFETFHDRANGIRTPADVSPHWEEAAERHGMPVDAGVWLEDPLNSSHPANIAYKAAEFQSQALADSYLRRLREAGASERYTPEEPDELAELAGQVGLDVEQFREDLASERAREAFEADMRRTLQTGAKAFPSYLVKNGENRRLLRGYQSTKAIVTALTTVDPTLDQREPPALVEFLDMFRRVATREVEEVYGLSHEDALDRLETLADDGHVTRIERGSGIFWE